MSDFDFDAIMAEQEAKIKAEEAKGSNNYSGDYKSDFNEIQWVAPKLSVDKVKSKIPVAFQMLSMPDIQMFKNKPTRIYTFEQSKITGDDGKDFFCNWSDDQNWILRRVMNAVTKGNWIKTGEFKKDGKTPKKKKTFHYEGTKELDRVLHNGKEPFNYNGKMIENKGWYPKAKTIINVVDLRDLDYHFETGKAKLLSSKIAITTKDDGTKMVFPETGIGHYTYTEQLFNGVIKKAYDNQRLKDHRSFPILFEATDSMPYYKFYFGSENTALEAFGQEMKDIVARWYGLTPAEKEKLNNLELINVRKYWKPTSYSKLFSKLGQFFKAVDGLTGQNFYNELESLVAREREQWEKEKAQKKLEEKTNTPVTNEAPTTEITNDLPSSVEEDSNELQTRTQTRARPSNNDVPFWKTLDENEYKGLSLLTEDMKKTITGKNVDGSLNYISNDIYMCGDDPSSCMFVVPGDFSHCPKCGKKF